MSHGDDTIQKVDLADNINAAFDKINENFELLDAGLDRDEVIALITEHLNDNPHFSLQEIRDHIEGATLDMSGNKVLFGNMYSSVSDLPDAATHHGMFAHVHDTAAAYFAHGGQWIELANKSDVGTGSSDVESLDDLDDV